MMPVMEAVPNFSEGRDEGVVRRIVAAIEGEGSEVVDWSMDRDHNRSVVTFLGSVDQVEASAVAAARVAVDGIDLRKHQGVHPRIGALDVLPFVPLLGAGMELAVEVARRVAARLASELSVPTFLYSDASNPPGRRLADLRRGGVERLWEGFPEDRIPDFAPPSGSPGPKTPHPTAGATCVGARQLLLAWNVEVEGVELPALRELAGRLRATGGGFPGLRVLGLHLESRGISQLSMNLERVDDVSPFAVFTEIEAQIERLGGNVLGTEVIGMVPNALVLPAAKDRLGLVSSPPGRFLSECLANHVSGRAGRIADEMSRRLSSSDSSAPAERSAALARLIAELGGGSTPGTTG